MAIIATSYTLVVDAVSFDPLLVQCFKKEATVRTFLTSVNAQQDEALSTPTFSLSPVLLDDLLEFLNADLLDQPRPSLLAVGPAALGTGGSTSSSCHSPGFLRDGMMVHIIRTVTFLIVVGAAGLITFPSSKPTYYRWNCSGFTWLIPRTRYHILGTAVRVGPRRQRSSRTTAAQAQAEQQYS